MNVCFMNYLLFCFRCILVIIPCPGYIHPDEYFQSSELMGYEVLNLKSNITWEWMGSSPIRNILHPVISTGFVFWCIKMMRNIFGICYSAEILVIVPRLFSLIFIWVIEKCLMRMFCWVSRSNVHQFGLFLFRSSFVSLVLMTRAFSNVMEAMLFTVLLHMVSPYCMKMKEAAPLSHLFLLYLGFVIAVGCFIRPTFLIYAFYPMLHLFGNLVWRNKSFTTIIKFLIGISIGLFIGTCCMLILDHHYYSSKIGIQWPITPLNFIFYNTNIEQVRKHGIHPRYLHILVNMFILFGPLYLVLIKFIMTKLHFKIHSLLEMKQLYKQAKRVLLSILNNMFSFSNNSKYEIRNFMLMSAIIPVCFLSIIPHQEARFLLPVFIPLLLLTSSQVHSSQQCWKWVFSWLMFNSFCILWYGFLHQSGVYKSLAYMNRAILEREDNQTKLLIYWHTYMVPQHLLGISNDDQSIKIYDLGGSNYHSVTNIINEIIFHTSGVPRTEIWLFCHSALHSNVSDEFSLVRQFYPHVSMEDIPMNEIFKYFLSFQISVNHFIDLTRNAFSLNMYHMLV